MTLDSSPVGRRIRLSYKSTYDSLILAEDLTIFSLKKKIVNCFGLENTGFYLCYLTEDRLIVIDTPSRLKEFMGLENCAEIQVLLKLEVDSDQSLREKLNRTIPFESKSRVNIAKGAYIPKSREAGPNKDATSTNGSPRYSSPGPATKNQSLEDNSRNPVDNWLDNTVVPPWDEVRGLKNPVFGKSFTLDSPQQSPNSSDGLQVPKKVKIKLADLETHKYGEERPPSFKPAFDEAKLEPKSNPKASTSFDEVAPVMEKVETIPKSFEAKNNLSKDVEARNDTPKGIEVKSDIPEVCEVKSDVLKGLNPKDENLKLNEEADAVKSTNTKSTYPSATPPKSSGGSIRGEIPRASPPSHLGESDIAYLNKATELRRLFNDYSFAFADKAHLDGIFSFLQDQILNDVIIDLGVVKKGLQRVATSQPIVPKPVLSAVSQEPTQRPDLEIKNSPQQCQGISDIELDVIDEMKHLGTSSDSRWVNESHLKPKSTNSANLRNITEKPFLSSAKLLPKQTLSNKDLSTFVKHIPQKMNTKVLPTHIKGKPVATVCPPNQRFEKTRFQPPKSGKVNIFDDSNSDGSPNSDGEIHLGKLDSQSFDDLYNSI